VVDRAALAAGRTVLGCLGLLLVLIVSMLLAWFFIFKPDGGTQSQQQADGPRAGPVADMLFVRFEAGHFEPSYAPKAQAQVQSPYEMSMSEVTREQFATFVRAKGHVTTAEQPGGRLGAWVLSADGQEFWQESAAWHNWRDDLSDDMPVVCVSWEDAIKFCNWLSEKERLAPCYRPAGGPRGWDCNFQANGYRLPTEAEWEYAARGGDKTLYPTPAENLLRHGWFRENSGGRLHPVCGQLRNGRDLCDVWGNAWEWCWDRRAKIPQKPALDPAGPEQGDERIARGGSWCDAAPTTAAQTRKALLPDYRASNLGFRVARTLPSR
jgi:formylglycine-generating enzyme required for sulfatase activity